MSVIPPRVFASSPVGLKRFRGLQLVLFAILAVFSTIRPLHAQFSTEPVWSDEFNYSGSPDPAKWTYDTGGGGWGNDELQYYTSRTNNARVENGMLVINAVQENYGGNAYTSARLRSHGQGDWTYGRVEVRARFTGAAGTWPAIWMLPTDWVYGGWPDSGEIDIMEHVSTHGNSVQASVHTLDYNFKIGTEKTAIQYNVDYSNWHNYILEWYPDQVKVSIDNIHYFTFLNEGTGSAVWPFDQRFHLMLNVAVGGWGGTPSFTSETMEVDYVRAYSYAPSPSTPFSGTPMTIPGTIEAEDYDNGGQGSAYNEFDAVNNGSSYRTSEGVDIEVCTDTGGGYDVGWTAAGEWMKYTVDVASAGDYTITTRVARGITGTGAFHIEVDDVDVTGSISVGDTGGWQNWVNKTTSNVSLSNGEQAVMIVIEAGDININHITFALVAANNPPVFTVDPINKPNAVQEAAYSDTIAGSATDVDAGDTLTYSKDSGPTWLNVATNGTLSGTPGSGDVGLNSWSVQVSDGLNRPTSATLEITVDSVNYPPFFTTYPIINKPNAAEGVAYSDTIAGDAIDPEDDPLIFSKSSGPDWLSVATNGALSGMPDYLDIGTNSWTVQVSDGTNSPASATLQITVESVNEEPVFTADTIVTPNAVEGIVYSTFGNFEGRTLADWATDGDPGDTLSYSKVSGPAWLNVFAGGRLAGTPGASDVGLKSWIVQVSDGNGGTDTAILEIAVFSAIPPVVNVQVSGSNLEIVWPASYAMYNLYSCTNLLPPVVWSAVTNSPVIQGDYWMVAMPLGGTNHFFRLGAP